MTKTCIACTKSCAWSDGYCTRCYCDFMWWTRQQGFDRQPDYRSLRMLDLRKPSVRVAFDQWLELGRPGPVRPQPVVIGDRLYYQNS